VTSDVSAKHPFIKDPRVVGLTLASVWLTAKGQKHEKPEYLAPAFLLNVRCLV